MTLPLLTFDDRAGGIKLDLNQLIVSRLLIQANSGGGKSHAVRYMLEQCFGKVQQIVIDPEGEFATLRERYPFLLVGRDGDVPADIRGAKLLPRKLLELGLSAIIDLSEFGLPQQRSYVQNFTEALNHLPRELWKDCLIYYDEGHRWAPEIGRSSGKEVQPLTEAISTLQSAGRKRGFCGIIATQRLSKLNKDVAAECLNKLIGRTSNEDIKRAGDELGLSKLQGKELRSLEPGTFWTYGPAISIDPVMVRTGPISTHPPKRGAARAPAPAAPGAIKKVLAELADLPKEAEEEARSIADLQRRNADLERRIRHAEKGIATKTVEKPVVDQASIDRAVGRAVAGERDRLRRWRSDVVKLAARLEEAAGRVQAARSGLVIVAGEMGQHDASQPVAVAAARNAEVPRAKIRDAKPTTPVQSRPATRPEQSQSDGSLSSLSQKVLDAIAFYNSIGQAEPSKRNVAGFCGVNPALSTWRGALAPLRARALVAETADRLSLTDEGRQLAADVAVPSLAQLQQDLLSKLSAGARAIAAELIEAYPNGIARDDLGERVGVDPKVSTWRGYMAELRKLGLIDDQGDGYVASDLLFPEGLG